MAEGRYYEGNPCFRCGGTKRYLCNWKCIKCHQAKAKVRRLAAHDIDVDVEDVVSERQNDNDRYAPPTSHAYDRLLESTNRRFVDVKIKARYT